MQHNKKKKNDNKDVLNNEKPSVSDSGFIVVGKNPVKEAMRAGNQIDKLLIQKDNHDHVLGDIVSMAKKRHLIVKTVDKRSLDAMAEGQPHQGVAAMMAPFHFQTVEDAIALAEEKGEEPFLIILDHIQDPHNFGAIVRSANLCGAHGVIFPNRRSASVTAVSVKAASGAMSYTPLIKVGNLSQTLTQLKEKGFWIAVADMDGDFYGDVDMKGRFALVIGSEGKGVSDAVKKQCDFTASIPIYGDIDSFNASSAAAILMCEAARQRHCGKTTTPKTAETPDNKSTLNALTDQILSMNS